MEEKYYIIVGVVLIFSAYVFLYIPKRAPKMRLIQKFRTILILSALGGFVTWLTYDDLALRYNASFESTVSEAIITVIKLRKCNSGSRRNRGDVPCWDIIAATESGTASTNTKSEGRYTIGERVTVLSFQDVYLGNDMDRKEHWFFQEGDTLGLPEDYFLNYLKNSVHVIIVALALIFSAFAWLISIFLAPYRKDIPR